jgi:predicted ribosome quality control (RQC) complex YloA/Tae2 family protein
MHYDALTLSCMVAEIQRDLVPGRIQQVLLVDDHTVGLEIYAAGVRHQLLVATAAGSARLHCARHKLRRGVDHETPLLLLLRKYVRDGVLSRVEQPDPCERVAVLHIQNKSHGSTQLVVELIGRQSNVLLLDPAGRILDCLRRQPAAHDGARSLLPGHSYEPPPAQGRLPPLDDGSHGYYERLGALFLGRPGLLWRCLVDGLAGLSPTAAREVAWRAAGVAEAPAAGAPLLAIVEALQALWQPATNGEWRPGIVMEAGRVVGFAPYELHWRGEFVPQPTLSAALELYFGEQREAPGGKATSTNPTDPYAGQRAAVLAQVRRAQHRIQRQLDGLAADEPAAGAAAELRTQAEWLLALASQVAPGQRELTVDTGTEVLTIALAADTTPVQQAERMFARAAKLTRAAVFIPQRRRQLQGELDFLRQLEEDAVLAANQPELAAVRAELQAAGHLPPGVGKERGRQAPIAGPRRFRSAQGFEIVVGRNARQNEQVTFGVAQPGDTWLHARGVPGAHVVIRAAGRTPDRATIQAAAELAAYYSSAQGEQAAPVSLTTRKWVRRVPGGRPGQVIVEKEEVLLVPGRLPEGVTESRPQENVGR